MGKRRLHGHHRRHGNGLHPDGGRPGQAGEGPGNSSPTTTKTVHTLESVPTGLVQAQTNLPAGKIKVSLDATAYVVEEGQTVQVTVTLAEAPEEDPVYIGFTLTPANGAIQADFTAWSTFTRQLRYATVGDTTDRINIRADDDTLNDDGESLTLCLGDLPEPYATLAGLNCATINIMDNDDPNSVQVSFDRGNYWASEDGNPAWPRISVHPVPDREITIPITFTRGGGLSESDHSTVTTKRQVRAGPVRRPRRRAPIRRPHLRQLPHRDLGHRRQGRR